MKFLKEYTKNVRNNVWNEILHQYVLGSISDGGVLKLKYPVYSKPDLKYFILIAKKNGAKEFIIPTEISGIERINEIVTWIQHQGFDVKNISSKKYPFVLHGKL